MATDLDAAAAARLSVAGKAGGRTGVKRAVIVPSVALLAVVCCKY